MPYDEKSFLQGLAVGRALKGVTVLTPIGGGTLMITSEFIDEGRIILWEPDEVPNELSEGPVIESVSIRMTGQEIDVSVEVPSATGYGGITVTDMNVLDEIYLYNPTATPQDMDSTISVEATITIDEEGE